MRFKEAFGSILSDVSEIMNSVQILIADVSARQRKIRLKGASKNVIIIRIYFLSALIIVSLVE